jgi:hypothetical protein
MDRKTPAWFFFGLLLFLFIFRLVYGLTSEFWFEDELQIYLLGLKFFSTGHWPFFGPDIVYTASQIPGALQGLLVGIPLFLLQIPESPAILLNLITFLSLSFLAWYMRKRIPEIPWWFVWIWVLTCPWTLNYSTNVINPSYALVGGIFFFIAFLEAVPSLAGKIIKRSTAFFLMGFSMLWVMQLHMSWVLMVPYLLYALFISIRREKSFPKDLLFFCFGAMIPLAALLPTYMQYGMAAGSGGAGENIRINWQNFYQVITVISRYLSFASYELPRFLGSDTPSRLEIVRHYWPFLPFILYVLLIGLLQPILLFVYLFIRSQVPLPMRILTGITLLIIWLSFFFSVKGPSSHTFYITFPLAMIYSMFVWKELFIKIWFRRMMVVMLIAGFFTSGILIHEHFYSRSLYKNRDLPLKAIREKNYHVLGERRSFDRNE